MGVMNEDGRFIRNGRCFIITWLFIFLILKDT
jgi:hypothetical protein